MRTILSFLKGVLFLFSGVWIIVVGMLAVGDGVDRVIAKGNPDSAAPLALAVITFLVGIPLIAIGSWYIVGQPHWSFSRRPKNIVDAKHPKP